MDYNIHRLLLPSKEYIFIVPEGPADPDGIGFKSLNLNWKHVLQIQS